MMKSLLRITSKVLLLLKEEEKALPSTASPIMKEFTWKITR
jgi:hypothetical protein